MTMKELQIMEEKLLVELGEKTLLDALLLAMNSDEKKENFEYIARMYEVDFNS